MYEHNTESLCRALRGEYTYPDYPSYLYEQRESLYLEKKNLNANDIKLLMEVLKENLPNTTRIRKLFLKNNDFGDDGAMHIANFIKTNNTIELIGISDCNIGREGLKAISKALETNTHLTYVCADSNKFYDNIFGFGMGQGYDLPAIYEKISRHTECNRAIKRASDVFKNVLPFIVASKSGNLMPSDLLSIVLSNLWKVSHNYKHDSVESFPYYTHRKFQEYFQPKPIERRTLKPKAEPSETVQKIRASVETKSTKKADIGCAQRGF
jgi:hypothetical protein